MVFGLEFGDPAKVFVADTKAIADGFQTMDIVEADMPVPHTVWHGIGVAVLADAGHQISGTVKNLDDVVRRVGCMDAIGIVDAQHV